MNNNLRKFVLPLAGALMMLGAAAAVRADPITFITGPFEIKFADFEFANPPNNGANIGGIFTVSSFIPDGGGIAFWNAGTTDGTLLNGYFSNVTLTTIASGSNPAFTATGGLLTLYEVPVTDGFNPGTFPTAGIDPVTQLCGGVACPTPYLTALFVPGISFPPDSTSTVAGNFNSTTNPISGTGRGYLSVADLGGLTVTNGNGGANFTLPVSFVGTDNAIYNSNGFIFTGGGAPASADLLFQSSFFECGFTNSPTGCSRVSDNRNTAISDDPVRGKLVVPEPATLALLGLSMAALGWVRRRRNS